MEIVAPAGVSAISESEREALHSTMFRLESRWHKGGMDGGPWHVWDSLPWWDFLAGIRQAETLTDGRRFLDVGCGIGTKLALMYALGWDVAGIERIPEYAEAARELIPEAEIATADLFDIPVFDADVVYMYRPAKADALEAEVEEHVLSHTRVGTVMFWPFRHDPQAWVV